MIRLENVSKTYAGGIEAVKNVNLRVRKGETLVLIGTSGCGKTTTLKMINRLIVPTSGTILVNGVDIETVDPIELRRNIGYVIQKIGLFPHMTIAENVALVPRLKGWPKSKQRDTVARLLDTVGLPPEEFMHRYPAELSGGQQQRVGVARALAGDPPIILMDEPFGALDPITREQLQEEFVQLEDQINKTIVFVTHDIFEAVNLADRIAIMNEGSIVQIDTPDRILKFPKNDFIVRFLGKHRIQLQIESVSVDDVMSENPVTIKVSDRKQPVARAIELLKKHHIDSLPVVDKENHLFGVITIDTIRRKPDAESIADLIDTEFVSLECGSSLTTALDLFTNNNISALPVVDPDRRLRGLITKGDIANVFMTSL